VIGIQTEVIGWVYHASSCPELDSFVAIHRFHNAWGLSPSGFDYMMRAAYRPYFLITLTTFTRLVTVLLFIEMMNHGPSILGPNEVMSVPKVCEFELACEGIVYAKAIQW
jgi:hypothetical protein